MTSKCCGWVRRAVPVVLHSDQVLFIEICDVCSERQWFLDGSPIDPDRAVDLALVADTYAA
jgi:hypothetical protein